MYCFVVRKKKARARLLKKQKAELKLMHRKQLNRERKKKRMGNAYA